MGGLNVMPRLRRNNGPFDMGDDDSQGAGPNAPPPAIPMGQQGQDGGLSAIPTQPPSPVPSSNPGPSPVVQNNMPSASTDMSGGLPGVGINDAPSQHNWDRQHSDVPLASQHPEAASNATAGTGKVSNGNHPDIDLPDITTMPGYKHMTDVQGQLDEANRPLSTKGKLLRAAIGAAPIALGAALGGGAGAGGAASGVAQGMELQHQHEEHHKDDLIRQVQQAQGQVTTQYDHNLQAKNLAATRQMTDQWHHDVIKGQNDRADQRSTDNLRLHGFNPDGSAVDESQMNPKELAALHHQKAQDTYLQAETDYRNVVRTQKLPADIARAKAMVDLAKQNLGLKAQQVALAARGMDLREEGLDFRENGPTAQQKNQIGQAGTIEALGPKLIQEIRKNADILGPYSGRATNIEEFIGNLPPEAAYLSGLQGSFAALQPQLHGMRGQGAMKQFEARLQAGSFKTNADAMEAAVQAIIDSAATIKQSLSKPLNSAAQDRRKARNAARNTTQPNDEDIDEYVRTPNGIQLKPKGGK